MERYSITVFTEVKQVKGKPTNTHRYYSTGFHDSKAYVINLAKSIVSNLPSDEKVVKTEITRELRSVEALKLPKGAKV